VYDDATTATSGGREGDLDGAVPEAAIASRSAFVQSSVARAMDTFIELGQSEGVGVLNDLLEEVRDLSVCW